MEVAVWERMSDVYAAFGPLPSSLGVTPSPPPEIAPQQERRPPHQHHSSRYSLHPSDAAGALVSPTSPLHKDYESDGCHQRQRQHYQHHARTSSTLGRARGRNRHREDVVRSQQDLRRSLSKTAMDRAPEPLQLLQRLDSLDTTAARLRGSLQKLDSPIYLDRRRNGSAISTGVGSLESPYGSTTPCSLHAYSSSLSRSRRDSRAQLEEEEEHRCCFQSTCCKVFFSIVACLLILGGVIASLYFFIKCM